VTHDASGDIRAVAYAIADAIRGESAAALDEPNVRAATLAADIDPNALDRGSAAFRAGAAAALSSVIGALSEHMLAPGTLALLSKSQRARILAAFAAHPGLSQGQLATLLEVQESNLSLYVRELAHAGLVQPAVPKHGRGKAWRLTWWGATTLLEQLDGPIGALVPDDELEPAIKAAATLLRKQRSYSSKSVEATKLGYAATGVPFVLTDPTQPELVVVHNENLQAWLPPGGHFDPDLQDIPSEKVLRKIQEETGSTATLLWKAGDFERRDTARPLPAPSFVLLEDLTKLKSKDPHDYHFDLNYICRINDEAVGDLGTGAKRVVRVPLGELEREPRMNQIKRRIREAVRSEAPKLAQATVTDDVVERVVRSLELLRTYAMDRDPNEPIHEFESGDLNTEDQVASALNGSAGRLELALNGGRAT
jgi:hypothetical protein